MAGQDSHCCVIEIADQDYSSFLCFTPKQYNTILLGLFYYDRQDYRLHYSGQWWWYCKYIGKLIINNFTCFQLLANATRLYCQNWTMERCFCVLVVFGCFGAFACFGVFFCVLVRPLLIRCLLEYLSKIWLFNRVFLFCFCDSVLWIVMWCVMCKFLPNFALEQVAAVRRSRKSAYK